MAKSFLSLLLLPLMAFSAVGFAQSTDEVKSDKEEVGKVDQGDKGIKESKGDMKDMDMKDMDMKEVKK